MDLARRSFLYLTTGTMLAAKCGMAIAQIGPVRSMVGDPQWGAADIIVRLIRQWAAEHRNHSFIGNRMNAENSAATANAGGRQPAVSSARLTVLGPSTPPIDSLRSWARQKLVGNRTNC